MIFRVWARVRVRFRVRPFWRSCQVRKWTRPQFAHRSKKSCGRPWAEPYTSMKCRTGLVHFRTWRECFLGLRLGRSRILIRLLIIIMLCFYQLKLFRNHRNRYPGIKYCCNTVHAVNFHRELVFENATLASLKVLEKSLNFSTKI